MREIFEGSFDVAGLELESPVMIGAGPTKLPEHVLEIARSEASAIVVGSITLLERSGNEGTSYFADRDHRFSLNSKGLPNPGAAYYERHLPEMVQIAHDHGKKLIVSLAGFSPAEFAQLAEISRRSGADGSEYNLGCPNVRGTDGKPKQVISFKEDLAGETMRKVEQAVGVDGWTSVKLSPILDAVALESMATLLGRFESINAVTSINTVPNAYAFNEDGAQAIEATDGFGGMAGEAIKAMGLGQLKLLRGFLPTTIAVIGVGGISSGNDVEEYLRLGASATQVTTAYINFGPSVFSQILNG